jgi:ADP-heptose:LPS heptosyltransferase
MPSKPDLSVPVEWINLTYGEDGFTPKDFLETARIMETLDAVVTTDTSVVHMAGTLGIPTLMIPASNPEWRWGVPREGEIVAKSVWYPSVTLVRRKHTNAWPEALETVERLLSKMLKARAA